VKKFIKNYMAKIWENNKFKDRYEAGVELAKLLKSYKYKNALVGFVSCSAAAVAFPIAFDLHLPLVQAEEKNFNKDKIIILVDDGSSFLKIKNKINSHPEFKWCVAIPILTYKQKEFLEQNKISFVNLKLVEKIGSLPSYYQVYRPLFKKDCENYLQISQTALLVFKNALKKHPLKRFFYKLKLILNQ